MQEWGIYYFFEHKGGVHKLILVDDIGAHQPYDSAAYQTINYYPPSIKVEEEHCDQFQVHESLQSGQWVTDDFDFEKPRARLQHTEKMPRNTGNKDQELYEWPGDYVKPDEGRMLARIRMEAAGAPGSIALGSGNLRGVVPGCTFQLEKYPQDKANLEYLIVSAALSLTESAHASGQGSYQCDCQFQVLPTKKTYRSPRTVPKPLTTGPQTAIVTGPAGQEIWTDQYGRVKLSFHWNRYCTKDENSSCWIRVASPWAGSNFGGIALPRIGQEVIVDFENGDPDRPIVTGRVYNALNMPPWDLPANQTQSGVLTRSSLEGGPANANALRFEDKKGQEEVWLHAEKDQRIEVENDESHWVGHDRSKTVDNDETVHIRHDRTETVDNNETITVHNDRTETVDGHETITIHKTRTETVDGNETLTVNSNRTRHVKGSETETINKAKTETIKLAHVQTIGLGKMVNVGAAYNINVGGLFITNTVLSRMDNVTQSWDKSVGDHYKLVCGQSSLELKQDGTIRLTGKHITVNGGGSASDWESGGIIHRTAGNWTEHAASHSAAPPQSVPTGDEGPATEECQECKNKAATGTANSISFARGSETLTHTDFILPAPLPISWRRCYRSNLGAYESSPLGARWTSPYMIRLDPHQEGLRYHGANGRSFTLPLPNPGESLYEPVEMVTVHRTSQNTLHLERGPDWQEHFEATTRHWRLTRFTTPQGEKIDLTYETTATDPPPHGPRIIALRDDANPLPQDPDSPLPPAEARLIELVSSLQDTPVARASLQYNEQGRLIALWQHPAEGRLPLPETDAAPDPDNLPRCLARYQHNDDGDLTRAADENGALWHYTYQNHLLTRHTDRTGRGFNLEWEGSGPDARAVREWADDGTFDTRLAWHATLGMVTVTDALGYVTRHHVDRLGYTRLIEYPDGREERFIRDAAKNVVEHHQPDGHIHTYRYDARSRPLEHLRPDGTRVRQSWTPEGRLASIRDARGGLWQRHYTPDGQLAQSTDPLGRKTRYHYNEAGQLARITDAHGKNRTLAYNAAGQLTAYTDCSGQTSTNDYDARGRLNAQTNAAGQTTRYHYEAGQLAAIEHPDQRQTRFRYDPEGRLLSQTDPAGAQTQYRYTQAGLPASTLDAAGRTDQLQQDKLGRPTRLTNANGAHYHFRYDAIGRLTQETDFDGQITHYHYHPLHGRLQTLETEGLRINHEYDPMGRLIRREGVLLDKQQQPIANRTRIDNFTYDEDGRLIRAQNADSLLGWEYDAVGNLVREAQRHDYLSTPRAFIWYHQYNALNQRVTTIRPDGRELRWLTYGSGHVHGLVIDGEEMVGFERDELHREISRTLQNGFIQKREYNDTGHLSLQAIQAPQAPQATERHYSYNDGGWLTGIKDNHGTEKTYQYDPTGRLLSEHRHHDGHTHSETFNYDPAGNLLARLADTTAPSPLTALYNNRLSQFGDRRFQYDGRGNRIQEQGKSRQTRTHYEWDPFGRLSQIKTAQHEISYHYDALGRRLAKASRLHRGEERLTLFGWEGDTLVWEKQGQRITHYVYEPDSFTPLMQFSHEGPGQGIEPVWYACDHLGTPLFLIDREGETVWRAEYEAYGQAQETKKGTVQTSIRFPGQYFDAETGLHYNRHRYYDPQTGRYLSKDPIGLKGGVNLYHYPGNPIQEIDPLGLQAAVAQTPQQCTYAQTTGNLTCTRDGNETVNHDGYAGRGEGRNNPEMQDVQNVGPIPQGTYTIGASIQHRTAGAATRRLTPDPNNNMHGRAGFLIHGDNATNDASEGCIVMPRNIRDSLNEGDTLEVVE